MKNTCFLLLFVLLFFSNCRNKDEVDVEPEEVKCRLLKIIKDGELSEQAEYDAMQRTTKYTYYQKGKIIGFYDYFYDDKDKIIESLYTNTTTGKLTSFRYTRDEEGQLLYRENWSIINGKEKLLSRCSDDKDAITDCGGTLWTCYNDKGILSSKHETDYLDDNCSQIVRFYNSSDESGVLELAITTITILNGKKDIVSWDRTYARLDIRNKKTYEYTYNEYGEPQEVIITDEKGEIEVEVYEYACE